MNTRPFDPPNYFYTYGSEGPEDWYEEDMRKHVITRVKTIEIQKLFKKKNPTENEIKAKEAFIKEFFYNRMNRDNNYHIIYQFLDTLPEYADKDIDYNDLEVPKLINSFLKMKILNEKEIDYLYTMIDIPNIADKEGAFEDAFNSDESEELYEKKDLILDYYIEFVRKVLIRYDPYRTFENLISILKYHTIYYRFHDTNNNLRFMFINKINHYLIEPCITEMKLKKIKPNLLCDLFMKERSEYGEITFELIHVNAFLMFIDKGLSIECLSVIHLQKYLDELIVGRITINNIPNKLKKGVATVLLDVYMSRYTIYKRTNGFFNFIFKIITAGRLVTAVKYYMRGNYPGFKEAIKKRIDKYKDEDDKFYVSISKILKDRDVNEKGITRKIMNNVKPTSDLSHKKKIHKLLDGKSTSSSAEISIS
tara:strand:- start:4085 stop:5350 length:1266 start_codon:yes stop_codon:yes gene_type:complete